MYPLENLAGPQVVNSLWYDLAIPLLAVYPQKGTHTSTDTWMFTTVLFIRAKNWKHSKWPSSGKYLNKMWYIHTMGYYLAMKRNEVLIHTTDESWKTAC